MAQAKPLTMEQYLRNRLYGMRKRAEKKQVPFGLTPADLLEIISRECVYCGAPPNSEVDRMVPAAGYTKENCVSACHRCNTLKNEVVSYEEMLKVADILGWRKIHDTGYNQQ